MDETRNRNDDLQEECEELFQSHTMKDCETTKQNRYRKKYIKP